MQAVTMLVLVMVLAVLGVFVNATTIGVLAYLICQEIALKEFAPLRFLGLILPINLVTSINMLNVLIEVFATETQAIVNASQDTKEKAANVLPAPTIALVMDNAPTSKICHSKLL